MTRREEITDWLENALEEATGCVYPVDGETAIAPTGESYDTWRIATEEDTPEALFLASRILLASIRDWYRLDELDRVFPNEKEAARIWIAPERQRQWLKERSMLYWRIRPEFGRVQRLDDREQFVLYARLLFSKKPHKAEEPAE